MVFSLVRPLPPIWPPPMRFRHWPFGWQIGSLWLFSRFVFVTKSNSVEKAILSSRMSYNDMRCGHFSTFAFSRFIADLSSRLSIEKFQFQEPITAQDLVWADVWLSIVNNQIYIIWGWRAVRQRFDVAFMPSQCSSLLLFQSAASCFFASRLSVDLYLKQTLESSQCHVARVEKSINSFGGGCVCMCWSYWSISKLPWAVCIPSNRLHRENWFPRPASKLDSIRLIWSVQIDQFSWSRASDAKRKRDRHWVLAVSTNPHVKKNIKDRYRTARQHRKSTGHISTKD
jgi:hypothetical protein